MSTAYLIMAQLPTASSQALIFWWTHYPHRSYETSMGRYLCLHRTQSTSRRPHNSITSSCHRLSRRSKACETDLKQHPQRQHHHKRQLRPQCHLVQWMKWSIRRECKEVRGFNMGTVNMGYGNGGNDVNGVGNGYGESRTYTMKNQVVR